MMMIRNIWHFSLIFTTCSGCVFGFNNKDNVVKRSQIPWYQEKVTHEGIGLSDVDMQNVVSLGDETHFNETLKRILIPRVPDTQGSAEVRMFIIDQLENLGWTVENHAFDDQTPLGLKKFTNIIATLNPSAPRRLVIACHYDSKLTPEGFLGATDSAVPCAMMVNLAHTMQGPLNKHKLERQDLTLQLMFIDGEEAFVRWSSTDSIYGARKLSSKLQSTPFPPGQTTNELDRIDMFVLLDLIGTEDARFFSYFEDTNRWYARLVSFEKRLAKQGLLNQRPAMFRDQSYYGAQIEDDHIPFLRKGVPILHIIALPFPEVWHKMSDNQEALHPPTIQNMNTLNRVFVTDYLHLSL